MMQMWIDGMPNRDERSILEVVRVSLGVKEEEHVMLERDVQIETFKDALRSAWRSGIISSSDDVTHENLRKLYGITPDECLPIKVDVMREMGETNPES